VDDGALYTMRQAAQWKGVSYHTVSRAVRLGILPHRRLGRQVLIAAADLTAWQPMYSRAPRKYRRVPDPAATAVPTALLERADLDQRVAALTGAARAVVGKLALGELRALCEGLGALLEEIGERSERHRGIEEDGAPPDLEKPGAT
jgi:excisionase family DNA binding protein